jgi:hypothetical protein
VKSGSLSTGDHALRSVRDLMRARRAKRKGHLKAAAGFEHGDHVVDPYAFDKPKPGRCDIDRALCVV